MGNTSEGEGLRVLAVILILLSIRVDGQVNKEYGCPSQDKILPCRCSTRGMEFQIWCSHSELPSVLQGLIAVSHYVTRPVDELILENNNLPSLPGKVFTSLRVVRLMLRNNRLERVSSGWLDGLHDSLLELFLVEPDLRSLPLDSLDNLQGLEAITVQSKSIKRLPRFSGLPNLRYLQVNSPALMELSPSNFRDLPNLEQIHIFGSARLARLEAGLFKNLPKLSLVNVSSSGVAWIHPRSMKGLNELKEFSLVNNMINDASIVGRATANLGALTIMNLDGNRVTRLYENCFVDNPSLHRLSLARNHITEILPGAFQRLPTLKVLDLNHNRIRRVHAEFFVQPSGTGLEELWISNNDLSHVNELRSILETIPSLRLLEASYNILQEIPFGSFRGHLNLERLHLDHNRLSFLQRESFSGMPALRELRLRNNSLSNLLDPPFWNLPNLKGLDLSENYFRRVNSRLLGNLPNLRHLDLSGNGITMIEPESFIESPALEHINISGNAVSTVHPLTFRHLTNLYELDLGWNRLQEVVAGLPQNIEHLYLPMNRIIALPSLRSCDLALPALRSFDISGNGIERIPPAIFSRLPNLRKLNLGYNALKLLEDGTFDSLAKLEQLDLKYNRLVSLHGRCFKPLRSLMDLNLRGNRLEVIRPDLFQGTPDLQRLDLSRNNLAQIPHAMFHATRELRELYASHNTLTELPGSLHGLKTLEILDLSFNKLNILSPKTLSSLTSLLELKLVRNSIKELRTGAFDRLPHLSFIDLENNDLRIIERNAIRSLPELHALRLGKNKLTMIPGGAFSELPLLQSAELQENLLQEIATNAFTNVPHLLLLNLSHNQLPEMAYMGLESLRSLEVLDLSNNRLSRVLSESLDAMEWLVELKMDNNRICTIQGSPFDNMPRLRVLSLRNNRMSSVSEEGFKRLRSNIAILDIDGNPLSCSCSMLWLKGWIQQTYSDGPRCANGSLFRELRLSRQECERMQPVEHAHQGCESDTANQSSSIMSSSMRNGDSLKDIPSWLRTGHKDSAKDPHLSQNMDNLMYSYNMEHRYENTSEAEVSLPYQSTSMQSLRTSLSTIAPQTELNITEATVRDATSSNANIVSSTLPSTKKNTSFLPSPSSSGFTFFGVPLPNLSFNLWGNSREQKAQRKLDNATGRPGRSRYRAFPPTEPEIHRGGFVPLVRGQGGFVPIPDPRLSYEGRNTHNATFEVFNRTATVTRVYQMSGSLKGSKYSHADTKKNHNSSTGNQFGAEKESEELTTTRNDAAALSSNANARRVSSNSKKIAMAGYHAAKTNQSAKSTDEKSESIETNGSAGFYKGENLDGERRETLNLNETFANEILWKSSSLTTIAEDTTINETEDEAANINESLRLKQIGIWDVEEGLSSGKHISTIPEEQEHDDSRAEELSLMANNPSIMDVTATSQNNEAEEISHPTRQSTNPLEASALSAMLIPGGQISVLKSSAMPSHPPLGRSTVTKVASPYLSLAIHRAPNDDSKFTANLPGHSVERAREINKPNLPDNKMSSIVTLEKGVETVDNNSFNWYFENYNESNLEPYVGVVHSGDTKRIVFRWTMLLIVEAYFVTHAYR